MEAFIIPKSWGDLETQAENAFGFGKESVLELLHNLQTHLGSNKDDQYKLIYAAGWLEGVLHARRELERAQKYPDTIRDLGSMLEHVSDQYRSDLVSEGRKMGIQLEITHNQHTIPERLNMDLTELFEDQLDDLLAQDSAARSVPTAMFILFAKAIDPTVIYQKFIDGFSVGYNETITNTNTIPNTVSRFLKSSLPRRDEGYVFINHYIFESENSDLIVNTKLYMNPLIANSVLRLENELDDSVIAEVEVNHRLYDELRVLKGQEDDYLQAARLLMDSLAATQDKNLIRALAVQASNQIVIKVADDFSARIADVYDKPFAEHVQRLRKFSPVSKQYKNFIAPNGYENIIEKITEFVSSITGLSGAFFTELDNHLNELRQTAGIK